MTAETDPLSLRERLKLLREDLEEATESHLDHLRSHPCRGRCAIARELGEAVATAERAYGLTRFLNAD